MAKRLQVAVKAAKVFKRDGSGVSGYAGAKPLYLNAWLSEFPDIARSADRGAVPPRSSTTDGWWPSKTCPDIQPEEHCVLKDAQRRRWCIVRAA